MTFKKKLLMATTVLTLLLAPAAARAEPISSTIIAVGTWLTANAALVSLALSVGSTLLALAMAPKNNGATSGVKTSTSTGGVTAQTFIMGTYLTSGHMACPLMSFGNDGKTPNAYLTYVVILGAIPGHTLRRIVVADNYVDIGGTLETIPETSQQGYPLLGDYDGYGWIRYHDGSQTVADALLVEQFSAYPDRPWSSTMVGRGKAYAVVVFKYNQELMNSPPKLSFEMGGIPLYDPRYDTTVGGDGTQRWDDQSTWVATDNLPVMIYNIHRGIALPGGKRWGGIAQAEDLPLDNWFTAMNEADVLIDLSAGGTEAQYWGGCEISVDQQPADVMDKLAICCNAQQVEIGGVWKIRVGGPGLPAAFFTDEDILVSADQTQNMFPGLDETNNAITATHPLPASLWNSTDAPARYNEDWEAEDDDQQLVVNVDFPCVYSPTQVQRLMTSMIADDRRFRRHSLSMGPYASMFEPLDSIAWTSVREGYTNKVFEIIQTVENLRTININFSMRERDSADFSWDVSDELPWVAALPGSNLPLAQAVPGWALTPTSITDADGTDRRPAISCTWNGPDLLDVDAIMIQIRVKDTLADVCSPTATDVQIGGIVISEGLLPATTYQGRAQLKTDRPTDWTSWVDVTTLDIRLSNDDLPADLINQLNTNTDDLLKFYLDLNTYKQITDALLYTGDGKSVQLVALQATNKAENAVYKIDLIGALSADSSAFVLNTSFVKIDAGTTLAGYINTVNTSIGDLESSVTETVTAVDGLKANYVLKVQAGRYIAGLYANADDTVGTSEVGVFASKFFLGDTSDPDNPIQVFSYAAGIFTLNGNVQIDGNLNIINGSITKDGIAVGNITNTAFESIVTYDTIDTAVTPIIVDVDLETHDDESDVQIAVSFWTDALHGSLFYVDLYRDSTRILRIPQMQLNNTRQSWSLGYVDENPPIGDHTYSLQMTVQTGSDTSIGFLYRYLQVTELIR